MLRFVNSSIRHQLSTLVRVNPLPFLVKISPQRILRILSSLPSTTSTILKFLSRRQGIFTRRLRLRPFTRRTRTFSSFKQTSYFFNTAMNIRRFLRLFRMTIRTTRVKEGRTSQIISFVHSTHHRLPRQNRFLQLRRL